MTIQIKVSGPQNMFIRRPDKSRFPTDPRASGDNLIKKLPFLRKIHLSVNFPAQKMAMIIKDIGEIWTRLFDHRPFLSGELKFFIREFEEKRSDREIEGLFEILENVTDVRDSQTDRIILAAETHLPPLKKSILESVEKCNKILSKEQIYRSDIALERNRELRKAEWESFIQDMSKKCQKVDETFKEKENDIRNFYLDIERKLHISSDLDES